MKMENTTLKELYFKLNRFNSYSKILLRAIHYETVIQYNTEISYMIYSIVIEDKCWFSTNVYYLTGIC